MQCPQCGSQNPDTSVSCASCGAALKPPVASSNPFAESNAYEPPLAEAVERPDDDPDAALRWLVPIGQSVYAVLAGYAGLLSLGCCVLGPLAILFGILAIADIKKHPKRHGMFRAIIGIVLGTIGTIGLIFAIIAAIADQS